jgi:hypothetical protein
MVDVRKLTEEMTRKSHIRTESAETALEGAPQWISEDLRPTRWVYLGEIMHMG